MKQELFKEGAPTTKVTLTLSGPMASGKTLLLDTMILPALEKDGIFTSVVMDGINKKTGEPFSTLEIEIPTNHFVK
jgi:Ni2+-binding GTPase involved in maturation of urease and hydrogenase